LQKIIKLKIVADPYPPYQWEESGILRGADYEIITEALRIHGIEAEITLHTWVECMKLMENQKVDGIFQIMRTPEREKNYLFSDILRTAETIFFKRKNSFFILKNDVDISIQIQGLKIGTLSGYSYNSFIDNLGSNVKKEVNSNQELLLGLQQKNFDLILIDKGVASYLIKKFKLKNIEKSGEYLIKRNLYIAFQKKLKDIVTFFNTGLQRIKERGIYDQILYKYI